MKDASGLAALRRWPVQVMVGDHRFLIRALPASAWLPGVLSEDWIGLILRLVEDDDIADLAESGQVNAHDLTKAGRDAVEVASGMRWWTACRLVKSIASNVEIAGALLLHGIDVDVVSLGGLCASTYRILVENQDDKGRRRLDSELSRVPAGLDASELYDPQVAAAQFERMFAGG